MNTLFALNLCSKPVLQEREAKKLVSFFLEKNLLGFISTTWHLVTPKIFVFWSCLLRLLQKRLREGQGIYVTLNLRQGKSKALGHCSHPAKRVRSATRYVNAYVISMSVVVIQHAQLPPSQAGRVYLNYYV